MLIDTHCHLDAMEFDADRDAVVQRARASGVGRILVPAVETAGFDRTAAVVQRYSCCRPAYGIHPLYVDRAQPGDLELLRHRLELGGVVAVGEIGLDYFVDGADRERQGVYFSGQLELAREFGLPVVLHIRRAVDDILKYLRRIRVRGGIAHAFNGSAQQAQQFIELGFCLGFGGTMSFEGSRRIRRLATELPEAALVLETDAPDMAPEWARGQRNAPCNVARFASELARLRNCATPEVVRFTGANALRVIPGLA